MKHFKITEIPDADYVIDRTKCFRAKGLGSNFFMERNKLSCNIKKDDVTLYNIKYNSNSILLGKKEKGYFQIFDYAENYLGFIDEVPRMENVFAIEVVGEIYTCLKVKDDTYLIYCGSKSIGYVERQQREITEYDIFALDEECANLIILISLYIDRKWFEDEKIESSADKGLESKLFIPKFPKISAFLLKNKIEKVRKESGIEGVPN